MNGLDPEAADIATASWGEVTEQLLHLSAAAALRQALMSRPHTPGQGSRRRRWASTEQVTLDAYYLAQALAADAGGDPDWLVSLISAQRQRWLEPAALIGRLQVRFLEQVCAQIDLTANHLPVPAGVAALPASDLITSGERITGITTLLPDRTGRDSAGEGDWLHATSTVVVEGRTGSAVVDAGPSVLPAAWSARIAAPVTVSARPGLWPLPVVRGCLSLCEDAVRQWIGSMTRELAGTNNEDLLMRVGPPLRWFLTSPASRAIAGRSGAADRPISLAMRRNARLAPHAVTTTFPIVAAEHLDAELDRHTRAQLLAALRGLDGTQELPSETVIDDAATLSAVHGDELTLLTAVRPEELHTGLEVTVNLRLSDWEDVTDAVSRLSAGQVSELTAPLLAWADRDVVAGQQQRLTLRARVHRGVPVRTPDGFGVFLAPGTRLTVLGTEVSKNHCTIYLDQGSAPQLPGVHRIRDVTVASNVA